MRLKTILCIAVAALTMVGCNSKKEKAQQTVGQTVTAEVDSMVYGTCGEGTAMNTIELIDTAGTAHTFTLDGGDAKSGNVIGGLNVGDSLAVLADGESDGTPFAQTVINITTLTDRWVSLDRQLTLYKEGRAVTQAAEAKNVVSWRLLNGRLIIGADTLTIKVLGPDSLYLENKGNITGYRRISE